MSKVSIIVPAFNREKSIRRCIDSLLRQSYSDIEIIAINDGSTDGTLKILNEMSLQDSRLRIIDSANFGPSHARNLGLSSVTSPYVMFCDSDDAYMPETVSQMLSEAKRYNADITVCGYAYINHSATRKKHLFHSFTFDGVRFAKSLLVNPYILGSVCNKMYKLSLIDGMLFNTDLNYCEDADFNIRVVLNNPDIRIRYVRKILYSYYLDTESITRDNLGPDRYYRALSYLKRYELVRPSIDGAIYRYVSLRDPNKLDACGVRFPDYFLCADVPLIEKIKFLAKLFRRSW